MKNNRRMPYLLLMAFLCLVVFQEFLHNHKPDLHHSSSCPVFILQQATPLAPEMALFLFFSGWVVLFWYSQKKIFWRSLRLFLALDSRAPPFEF